MTDWVRQRDGRTEPFDADRICAVLFLVGERQGRPDAFLARELTDGVVHFLADEGETTLAVEDLRELVVKVVRELGHARLARAYEEHTAPRPEQVPARPAVERGVFAPELLSAHADGLLVLGGLDAPTKLAARVLPWPRTAGELVPALARMQPCVGETVALDGPEHWLAQVDLTPAELGHDLEAFARLNGLRLVLNVNVPPPPALVGPAPGPLFAGDAAPPGRVGELALALVEQAGGPLRVAWHLPAGGVTDARLPEVVRRAVAGAPIDFVVDRGRRSLHLAEGLDRDEPALLLRVGVALDRLPSDGDTEALLQKVGTLARLALSAGVQKRAYLRRTQGDLAEGFLLDRARLQVVPLGLGTLVERRTGRGLVGGGPALELGRRVLQRLRDVLRGDGRKVQLATCLDDHPAGEPLALGVRDFDSELARRLRAATLLQEVTERGLFLVPVPPDPAVALPRVLAALSELARVAALDRVRLHFLEGHP